MGLEKVIEKIQKEGTEKITTIIRGCRETSSPDTTDQTKNNRGDCLQRKKQELEKQIKSLKTQEASGIEIEVKKIRLNAEKDVLNTTYQGVSTGVIRLFLMIR